MPAYTFEEARRIVLERVSANRAPLVTEMSPLDWAEGRVLAAPIVADRDYPPTARSVRDGFAVRAADLPGTLRIVGEAAAGGRWDGDLQSGQAVEIMTGAPVPAGADTVVMVEHVTVEGDLVTYGKPATAGEFINDQGCEARAGDVVIQAGRRLDYADVAMLATVGVVEVPVYRRVAVSILATGDEIVPAAAVPESHQIRNSNAHSLASQVRRAGGEPDILPVARDTVEATGELVDRGLKADLLLLSGGVSAGKYDVVERVLAQRGAEFYIDRVLIQPGQPLVFGRARDTFFFGLPGNPASTMVCFEAFARAAIDLLSGQMESILPLLEAELEAPLRVRPGLTRFLPARLSADGMRLSHIPWSGSGDVPSLSRSNCFLVTSPDKGEYQAGERIRVLLR